MLFSRTNLGLFKAKRYLGSFQGQFQNLRTFSGLYEPWTTLHDIFNTVHCNLLLFFSAVVFFFNFNFSLYLSISMRYCDSYFRLCVKIKQSWLSIFIWMCRRAFFLALSNLVILTLTWKHSKTLPLQSFQKLSVIKA